MHLVSACCVALLFSQLVIAITSPDEATLRYYYGPGYSDYITYNLSDAHQVLQHPNFILNNETHLYIHGYLETQESESVRVIVDAYLERKNINLLSLDWAEAASEGYITAGFTNIDMLAPVLGDTILSLYDAGLPRKRFAVVGHSLGSQMAGKTGRHIIEKTDGRVKIYRMAVLDAAFPLYFNIDFLPTTITVNRDDAEYLQAIHTAKLTYGQPGSIGHVDFWPNGGNEIQPGCPIGLFIPLSNESLCSHHRSWRFWAESIIANGRKFLAFPSTSYLKFLLDGPRNLLNQPIEMGNDCPISASGDYYLKTNSESPFAMGLHTVY